MNFKTCSINRHLKIKVNENYTYILPHIMLRKYVAHYTIVNSSYNKLKSEEKLGYLNLIPDSSGCIVCTYKNKTLDISIWGATTQAVQVENDINYDVTRFFIEFLPGALYELLGIKQIDLCDKQLQLCDVDYKLYDLIKNRLEYMSDLDSFIDHINIILLKYLEKNQKSNAVIESSIIKAYKSHGIMTVGKFAESEYISTRQLNRLFNEYVGMSAKMFLRLVRINHTINSIKNTDFNLAENAQIFGFYDQAHFIKDFKDICGVTPNLYLENMSDFYNEEFKF